MPSAANYRDFSDSVRHAFERSAEEGSTTAGAIAVELQTLHPEYGLGKLGEATIDPNLGPKREIAEWAELVRSRYGAEEVRATAQGVIDTRLTLLALMHLDESLAASMTEAGLVGPLRSESELRPRQQEEGAPQASHFAAPRRGGGTADHVFICYSRKDSAVVREIDRELRLRGVSTWIDTEDIPPGANWDRSIDDALRDTPCLMVFLSSSSVASDEVQGEWSLALDEDKAVIPVLLEDCEVPRRLRARQHIELFERPLDSGRLDRLAATLRDQYGSQSDAVGGRGDPVASPAEPAGDRDIEAAPRGAATEPTEPAQPAKAEAATPPTVASVAAARHDEDAADQEYPTIVAAEPVPPSTPSEPATTPPRPSGTRPTTLRQATWMKVGAGAAAVLAVAIGVTTLSGAGDEDDPPPTSVTGTTLLTASPGVAIAVPVAAPTIDGDSADWPQRIRHETSELVFSNPQIQNGSVTRLGTDSNAEVSIGWNDTHLYVFGAVRDDILSQPNTGNQIWRGDAITINVSVGDQGAGASASPDDNDFQLTLSPGDPSAGTRPGSVIFSGVNGSFGNDRTNVAEVSSAFPGDEFAYVIEARIPWQVFGISDPTLVGDLGALVAVFDNDGEREADDTDPLQAVILGNTRGAQFQGPSTWGTLTLQR
jgi:hypothetical protein